MNTTASKSRSPLKFFLLVFALSLPFWLASPFIGYQFVPGVPVTALILGLVWTVWHIMPLLQVHRSPTWIAWWCLGTVAARVLMVWLYNNTGKSVFAMAVFHTTVNVTWQSFPIRGSCWDPRVNGVIMAIAAVLVVVVWGPRTLAGYRNA
jgi:hypothetical protein